MRITASVGDCRVAFTQTLLELAREDASIYALASDSRGSVTLGNFTKELPGQFVEIGIAEQNEIGVAAGLAAMGKKPFVCAPASFLSARSLEQIKVDVAYSRQNVKIVGVSGGISYGALGYTHHSTHDLAVMRAIAGIEVYLPCDAAQTRAMTRSLASRAGGAYVRMGRGMVPDIYQKEAPFEPGKSNLLRNGGDLTIIAAGEMVYHAMEAAKRLGEDNISACVLDMHTIKPLDEAAILKAAARTGRLVTMEEHSRYGGLGGAAAEVICGAQPVPLLILALPDEDIIPGKSAEVFAYYGLDGAGASQRIAAWMNQ
ncbi:MAG: transketolase family protein [Oscillospiraceae bacterium]|nr:transketolase family protein [Oscillospiraceae bacterium]